MKKLSAICALALCVTLFLSSCGKEKDHAPDPQYAGGYLGKEIIPVDAQNGEGYGVKVDLNEAERELIAHLVSVEAGDRSFKAQVCRSAMILNRITDGSFPDGAFGVVFDSGDFASVLDCRVSGTVPEGQRVTRRFKVAEKALDEALSGNDPTGEALYFKIKGDGGQSDPDAYECDGLLFYR